jgi:hypothetical protein
MDDNGEANVTNLIVKSVSTVGSTISSSNFLAILDGNPKKREERDGAHCCNHHNPPACEDTSPYNPPASDDASPSPLQNHALFLSLDTGRQPADASTDHDPSISEICNHPGRGDTTLADCGEEEGGCMASDAQAMTPVTTCTDSGGDVACAGGASGRLDESFGEGGLTSHPTCFITRGGDVTDAGGASGCVEESFGEGGLASHPTHFTTRADSRGDITHAGGAGSHVEESFQEGGCASHPTYFTTHSRGDVTHAGGTGSCVEESFAEGGLASHPTCFTTHSGGDITCAGGNSSCVENFQEGEGCCVNHPTQVTTCTCSGEYITCAGGTGGCVGEDVELFGGGSCANFQLF